MWMNTFIKPIKCAQNNSIEANISFIIFFKRSSYVWTRPNFDSSHKFKPVKSPIDNVFGHTFCNKSICVEMFLLALKTKIMTNCENIRLLLHSVPNPRVWLKKSSIKSEQNRQSRNWGELHLSCRIQHCSVQCTEH